MLQRISNRLVTDVNLVSRKFGVLNTIVSVMADHLLPHVNAQGCIYWCQGFFCQLTELCPTTGEVTFISSPYPNCAPPHCFPTQGFCC